MEYSHEMMLMSESGYCMPFDDRGKDVELLSAYGEQEDKGTGDRRFNHGIDVKAHFQMLAAVADGRVSGIGTDTHDGVYVVVFIVYGQRVGRAEPVRAGKRDRYARRAAGNRVRI